MTTVECLDLVESLSHFTGGDDHYRHWLGYQYTSGVKYLADQAGAYWLIDVIASHQPQVRRKIRNAGDRDFQVWEIKVNPDHSAKVICHNGKTAGEDKVIYKAQRIPYTDFPLPEYTLWCVDGVILLPIEY